MIRHVLGPLLQAAGALLLTGCKGETANKINVAFAGGDSQVRWHLRQPAVAWLETERSPGQLVIEAE